VEVRLERLHESALATRDTGIREDGIKDGLEATGHVGTPDYTYIIRDIEVEVKN
jgi:hypothetical protein